MKVSKEVVVGLVKAVELYLQQDFDAEMKTWIRQRDQFIERVSGLPHVSAGSVQNVSAGSPGSFYLPAAYVNWDIAQLGLTITHVVEALRNGNPRIVVAESPTGIIIRSHMLEEGEEIIIADRVKEIFLARGSRSE